MMRSLSSTELLEVWEAGRSLQNAQRAGVLLEAAAVEMSRDDLAHMVIGERDLRLLKLRELLFGSQLNCLAACPRCGQSLECSLQVCDLTASMAQCGLSDQETVPEDKGPFPVAIDGYEVKVRRVNCSDLSAIHTCHDVKLARRALLSCCVVEASYLGQTANVSQLPEAVMLAVEEVMETEDPLGSVQLELSCASCAHHWTQGFDVVSFLWEEIDAWAFRILQEVHTLAAVYGWREGDILAMNPVRRQAYLQLVGV